ncbi:MAG: asparagine synthase (glutamine-hydrolyzing) [Anaerolineales bacterium]
MCGIAAVIDLNHRQAARHLADMARTLRHRGPDDEGFVLFREPHGPARPLRGDDSAPDLANMPHIHDREAEAWLVGLAHRRLSILDVSVAGHGPMSDTSGALWITYNGEIYNYIELREDLRTRGYTFQTGTDTEVILAAYDAWGVDCLARFNGMFAFALWDARAGRLFCARDRFGIKPFYYFFQDGYFACASEIKALVANPCLPRRARPAAVYDYLAHGALTWREDTFFESIRQLPGGHALTLDTEGKLNTWAYYQLTYDTRATTPDYPEKVAGFRALLTDAVRLRLRSDVPVGSSLSGGLDSSSIVALANLLLQQEGGVRPEAIADQQRVFCVVYPGERFDERRYMQAIIDQTGAQAHFTQPDSARLWDELAAFAWHQDEPVNASNNYAQYCVMQLAGAGGVKVLLDGQGGDEVLGGYTFYHGYRLAQALRGGRLGTAGRELRGARRHSNVSWASLLATTGWNISPDVLRRWGWSIAGARLLSHRTLAPGALDADFARQHHRSAQMKHNPFPTLVQKLHQDVLQTNLPALLRYEDRNSMAFSIEARVPFLDHRLVEYAFRLGADAYIRDGWTKAILRDAMRDTLPPLIHQRGDKEGFTTPHQRWLDELTPQMNAFFADEARVGPYLAREALATLRGPDAARMPGVWRALNLESWCRAFDLG